MKKPLLSVIIPAYNEEKDIAACLTSLQNQDYPNLEIVVIDDGSQDKTREIVKRFKKVNLIKGKHKGPGFSRNLGAKKAKGDILIFVDADMTFDKNYLTSLTMPIIQGKSFGTEERFQKATNLDKIWSKCWGSYTQGYPNRIKKGNVFRAIQKSKFTELGRFDPRYGYADDMTFYFKYGIKSDLVDNAVCYHKNPETLNEIYKQSKWIGASFTAKYPALSKRTQGLLLSYLFSLGGIFAIPFLSLRKTIETNNYNLFLHYPVFYFFRYYGSLHGVIKSILTKDNTK